MFFNTKRSPRKTTRQTLSTEQLEPKAMFSVSPVEPVVALDVGPVNQTGYEFQAKDVALVKTYCSGYCFADTDGFMKIGDIKGEFRQTLSIGGTSGPGGTTYMTGEDGRSIVHPQFNVGEDGRMIVHPQYNVGEGILAQANQQPSLTAIRDVDIASESLAGSAGPGGDDIFMPKPSREIAPVGKGNGYAEAVGLDSSTLDTSSNVQPLAENVSLYDHVQTPRSQAFASMGR